METGIYLFASMTAPEILPGQNKSWVVIGMIMSVQLPLMVQEMSMLLAILETLRILIRDQEYII